MALTQLLGGPNWDVTINPDYALYADFHYFFNSGSVIRSNPWNSPQGPVAKVLNVKNITSNPVALNYVSSSGVLTSTTLTSGSTTQIVSQTIPLGLDNNAWLSASIVSEFTGSITARPTGSRWFELMAIRTVSQQTNVYTIADGATTITETVTGFPTSGSAVYRCSRTIPYLDQPFWLIRDLMGCTGGTTTTAAPTTTTTTAGTTTTTTLASQKYYVESCAGPADIVGVINITNAPLLTAGKIIRVNTDVVGYYCFQVYSTSTGTITLGTRSVTNIYTDCGDCSD
jgi:hypothetical protein